MNENILKKPALKYMHNDNNFISLWKRSKYKNYTQEQVVNLSIQVNSQQSLSGEALKNEIREKLNGIYENFNVNYPKDFSGLYIFIRQEDNIPFYVGISRKILTRLDQHLNGTLSNQATLAYAMYKNDREANDTLPEVPASELSYKEKDAIRFPSDQRIIAQNILRQQKITILPLDDHDEMYFLEFKFALDFQTVYNSFRTH